MVKIISDSTCDLTKELLEKYNISILPLNVLLGEDEFLDGVNIAPDDIYKWADANKTTPKTSAPSINNTIEIFRPYVYGFYLIYRCFLLGILVFFRQIRALVPCFLPVLAILHTKKRELPWGNPRSYMSM